jgi:hypothetical protein
MHHKFRLAAVLTSLLTVAALASPLAATAATKTPRVVMLTASEVYAVYSSVNSTTLVKNLPQTTLYAVSTQGKKQKLSDFNTGSLTFLTGSSLVQWQSSTGKTRIPAGDPGRVHWKQLDGVKTGGNWKIPKTETLVGSQPVGWVLKRDTGVIDPVLKGQRRDLYGYNAYSKKYTAYGNPFGNGSGYQVVAGTSGIIAASFNSADNNGNAKIAYMPYEKPGKWTTVWADTSDEDIYCVKPSQTHVGCTIGGDESRIGIFALDGKSHRFLYTDHPTACHTYKYVTVRTSLWLLEDTSHGQGKCSKGHVLKYAASTGHLVQSTRTYSIYSGLFAFASKAIIGKSDQSKLYTLYDVNSAPHTLVKG